MDTLSAYLRKRGLSFDATEINEKTDPILNDDEMLKAVAEMWNGKEKLLKLVIQARINAIGNYILDKAIPEEVMVKREAIVEIAALVDDLIKYAAESKRRNPEQGAETGEVSGTTDNTSPPTDTGESSL